MKTRLTRRSILASLFLGSALAASAVQVTFQVNMEVQATLGNFTAGVDTMEVHGSFDGWGAGITMSVSATNANVYQGTTDITAAQGSTVQYKFVINRSGVQAWEADGVGPGGAQNRALTVPGSAQTLAAVYFNNQSSLPGITSITFRVNLGIQQLVGNFDPLANTVEARGSFDSWGAGITLTASATDSNIYEGSVDISGTAGATIQHKYVINKAGTLVWEGNVGAGGATGNRTFTLADTNQTLPVVYFDNLTNDPGAGIPVTFQVDMSVQTALGYFDPSIGSVDVRGQFNNWGNAPDSPFLLTNSPALSNLFVGTINIKSTPGNAIAYKFTRGGGWENGNDRTFVLAASAQTLPTVFFDRVNSLGLVSLTNDAPNQFTLTWTGSAGVLLQSSTNLSSWKNHDDTLGASIAVVTNTPGGQYFRLGTP